MIGTTGQGCEGTGKANTSTDVDFFLWADRWRVNYDPTRAQRCALLWLAHRVIAIGSSCSVDSATYFSCCRRRCRRFGCEVIWIIYGHKTRQHTGLWSLLSWLHSVTCNTGGRQAAWQKMILVSQLTRVGVNGLYCFQLYFSVLLQKHKELSIKFRKFAILDIFFHRVKFDEKVIPSHFLYLHEAFYGSLHVVSNVTLEFLIE